MLANNTNIKNDSSKKEQGYLFFLGNNPELAKKEIENLAATYLPFLWVSSMITSQVLAINTINRSPNSGKVVKKASVNINQDYYKKVNSLRSCHRDFYLSNFFQCLGGTIKVAQIFSLADLRSLELEITKFMLDLKISKITFAISDFTNKIPTQKLLRSIKKNLKDKNIAGRFILPKVGRTLSSAQVFHNHLTENDKAEINLINQADKVIIAQTIHIQNPNKWSEKDYGIPAVNPKAGLLPPKLARMMINLSLDKDLAQDRDLLICDPFCGNGRILLEARELGFSFIGSDIEEKQVEMTRKNLIWLSQRFDLKIKNIENFVFQADARELQISTATDSNNIIVVTEPYLGPALTSLPLEEEAKKIAADLVNFYLQTINNLRPQVKKIVMVMPAWRTKKGQIIKLSDILLDKSTSKSYHLNILGEYSRPDSFVIREIIAVNCRL